MGDLLEIIVVGQFIAGLNSDIPSKQGHPRFSIHKPLLHPTIRVARVLNKIIRVNIRPNSMQNSKNRDLRLTKRAIEPLVASRIMF